MYKISYEKCVCFVFLVILTVLSCSGFRIDSLAMTDVVSSRGNPQSLASSSISSSSSSSFSNSDEFFDRIFGAPTTPPPSPTYRHRIRHRNHHRQARAHVRLEETRREVLPPPPTAPHPSERLVQTPVQPNPLPGTSKRASTWRGPFPGVASVSNWPGPYSGVTRLPKQLSSVARIQDPLPSLAKTPNPSPGLSSWPGPSPSLDRIPGALTSVTRFPDPSPGVVRLTKRLPGVASWPDPLASVARLQEPLPGVAQRLQRSPASKRRHGWVSFQEEDFTSKAYRAELVLLATAQSRSKSNCIFKVHNGPAYKNVKGLAIPGQLNLPCDQEERLVKRQPKGRASKGKGDGIHLNKQYVLFLNASSGHDYRSVGAPKMMTPKNERNIEKAIRRVCSPNFVPKPPRIKELKENITRAQSEKRKLICKVSGFPIPKITWRRKGETLHQSQYIRIQYKRKQSKLTLKRMEADDYECVAHGVDGEVTNKTISHSESISSGKECDKQLRHTFCRNGGTCRKESSMGELYCVCTPGYSGRQCEAKLPSHSSMYPQTAIYTCKLGLSTKYFC